MIHEYFFGANITCHIALATGEEVYPGAKIMAMQRCLWMGVSLWLVFPVTTEPILRSSGWHVLGHASLLLWS